MRYVLIGESLLLIREVEVLANLLCSLNLSS